MIIRSVAPASVPKSIAKELVSERKDPHGAPGLIVSTEDLSKQRPNFRRAVAELVPPERRAYASALIVPPEETSVLFKHSEELALLKSIAGLIAEQFHPYAKAGVDVVWIVYKAAQLKDEWDRPDRDAVACGFKMASLALDSVKIAGHLDPDLKLPDAWANGFNFVVKSGAALWQGKTAPVNELTLSSDKRLDIPIKVLKLAGLSLDPPSGKPDFLPGRFMPPKISPIVAAK
jgi:hypothetical protein